jgi:SAM-dependent methyltransferase
MFEVGRVWSRLQRQRQRQSNHRELHSEIQALRNDIATIYQRMESLEFRLRAEFVSQSLSSRERLTKLMKQPLSRVPRAPRFHSTRDVEADLAKLQLMFPNVFPVWFRLFENARIEYQERPTASLSVAGNASAELFRKYLLAEITGHVLDIGCGPLRLPHYLSGQNVERIAGIDPLPGSDIRDFEFCQGFAEFLPWLDEEFDAVVIATSLDHVVSLDMAFSEILRVLRPQGVCVIWLGFIPGTKEYNPMAENISAIDDYHIFHFDRPWFLKIIQKYFDIQEEFAVDSQSFFYSLKRPSENNAACIGKSE